MSIGKRISKLRKESNLTQLELAEKLSVTDKAVSKWERGVGEPNTQSIVEMSKLFNVSVDYLLTGKEKEEKEKYSLSEKMAIDDDVESFKKGRENIDDKLALQRVKDKKNNTLVDYIYKHNSVKLFSEIVSNRSLVGAMLGIGNQYVSDFIRMSLEIKNYEWITPQPFNSFGVEPLMNLSQIYFEGQKSYNRYGAFFIEDDIIQFIYDREDVLKFLIEGRDDYWSNAISKVFELMVKNKHPKMLKLLEFIETKNKEAEDFVASKWEWQDMYKIVENGVYESSYGNPDRFIRGYTRITRQTVLNALENNDYKLAEKLNELSGGLVSSHEIKMDKIGKNKKMTNRNKLKESVIFDGIVDIDKLIALDDYDLYQETIKLPASEHEYALQLLESKEHKKLLSYAINQKLQETLQLLRVNELSKLESAINNDFRYRELSKRNCRYLKEKQSGRAGYHKILDKNFISLEDIKNHKDYRFFEHASKTDPAKLDSTLEYIVINRPNEYKLIKILLDNGAYITTSCYTESWHVSKDEITTQILRYQIDLLLKEDNKNDK